MTIFDLVVRGGEVVDGTGAEPVRADVGVRDGRVAAVGDLPRDAGSAARELDATGRLVLPGFIDVHSHAAHLLDDPDVVEAHLRQGVTTILAGQDGIGPAPVGEEVGAWVARYFGAVDGVPARSGTVATWLADLDGHALNAGLLVPAGSVRAEVVGFEPRAASSAELDRMSGLVADALDAGALGLSTGLDYVPGRFADVDELARITAPVGAVGGVYASHLRGYAAARLPGSVGEAREIGHRTGARVHLSHLHGPADVLQPLLAAGDATFDTYPYLRGATILTMLVLPPALQAGGIDSTLERLRSPEAVGALREALAADPRTDSITLSYLASPDWRWAEGLGLREAAARDHGGDVAAFTRDVLLACGLVAGCVMENGGDRTEEDVRAMLRHPAHLAGSDAILLGSRPHPRGWGAFARLLGRHVRDLGDWTWGEAARHLAGHAAERFALRGRGLVAPGAAADLVVLDPGTIADRSTYAEPRRPAEGVVHVLVNGVPAVESGRLTGARAGRALRRDAA